MQTKTITKAMMNLRYQHDIQLLSKDELTQLEALSREIHEKLNQERYKRYLANR